MPERNSILAHFHLSIKRDNGWRVVRFLMVKHSRWAVRYLTRCYFEHSGTWTKEDWTVNLIVTTRGDKVDGENSSSHGQSSLILSVHIIIDGSREFAWNCWSVMISRAHPSNSPSLLRWPILQSISSSSSSHWRRVWSTLSKRRYLHLSQHSADGWLVGWLRLILFLILMTPVTPKHTPY